jgi:thioredoxin reductase (NADPH)
MTPESQRKPRMRDNPTLTRDQIDRIKEVATVRQVSSGDVLYEPSHVDVPLFVVLKGVVTNVRTGDDEAILAVREAGQFTGEMSLIAGKRSLIKARVAAGGILLELSREKVLALMAKDTELSEVFIRVYVSIFDRPHRSQSLY